MASAADELVRIADAGFARAQALAGEWMACRRGCTQCCHGVFGISQADARRLERGLVALGQRDPEAAAAIAARAWAAVERLAAEFPGDAGSGILGETDEERQRFEEFANDLPCPALMEETGACGLYEARPLTCRVFGAPLGTGDAIGVCELCFVDAPAKAVTAAAIPEPDAALVEAAEREAGEARGETIIPFALARVG